MFRDESNDKQILRSCFLLVLQLADVFKNNMNHTVSITIFSVLNANQHDVIVDRLGSQHEVEIGDGAQSVGVRRRAVVDDVLDGKVAGARPALEVLESAPRARTDTHTLIISK